jgi:outer membrane protein assembly factor BamE
MKPRNLLRILLLFVLCSLVGCGYLRPYHVPIQQGNVLETKVVNQLAIGMSKEDVEDLLGTPILRNAFADNYWTYVYASQATNGKPAEQKQLVVYFAGNKLVKVEKKNV